MIRWAIDQGILERRSIRRRPTIGIGTLLVTGLAAGVCGAAIMYLTDPVSGRRRRHMLRDRALSLFVRGSEQALHLAGGMGNRTLGVWHSVTQRWHISADDRTLAERVKSALGHAAMHVSGVRVHVIDGVATLVGPVLHREAPAILRAAKHVRGVRQIIDRLEQRSDGQWARSSGGRIGDISG